MTLLLNILCDLKLRINIKYLISQCVRVKPTSESSGLRQLICKSVLTSSLLRDELDIIIEFSLTPLSILIVFLFVNVCIIALIHNF